MRVATMAIGLGLFVMPMSDALAETSGDAAGAALDLIQGMTNAAGTLTIPSLLVPTYSAELAISALAEQSHRRTVALEASAIDKVARTLALKRPAAEAGFTSELGKLGSIIMQKFSEMFP